MTLQEFKELLYRYNVPEHWYSLEEGLKEDALVLQNNHGIWEVFHFERGDKFSLLSFKNVEDAYAYIWDELKSSLDLFKMPPRY
ncbi:MAG: hypothetical protein SFW35_08030 [Chitinophagales bacterium]|nr:hypothetical protein [Chitinophagales bacterium]